MTTLPVLVGFALMLFLPCAIAVFSSRDRDDDSAYSDRAVAPLIDTRLTQVVQTTAAPAPQALTDGASLEAVPSSNVSDPALPGRTMKFHQALILRNEIEALMAAAVAARAQADALAANARLAAAKAEAADAEAIAAEELATAAIHEIRRAA